MNFAGYGTNHKGIGRCKFHGGSTPTHITHAIGREVASRMVAYGEPIAVDPMTALLSEVHRTAGHIAWLNVQLQAHPDPGTFEARVLLRHYQAERQHLVRVSKAAIDSGVAEREVRVAEQQGQILVGVIHATLLSLRLTPRQMIEARSVVAAELRRVAGEDAAA